MNNGNDPRLAVALCDIEPATFEHVALIREWLLDLGVDRVTLCVIPAADHHPFFQRSPALTTWLAERRGEGDAVAQQGFVGGRPAGARESGEHVRAGRRLLTLAGLEPRGYRAPSLAHVFGAWRELSRTFDWWVAAGARPARPVPPRDTHPRRGPPPHLHPPPRR